VALGQTAGARRTMLRARGTLEVENKLGERDADGPAERPYFDNIEPTLAALALAHKRLGVADPFGELDLSDPSSGSRLAQQPQKDCIFF